MSDELDETLDSSNETVDEELDSTDTDNNDGNQDDSANELEGLTKEQLLEQNRKLFNRAKKAEGFKPVKDPVTGKVSWVKKETPKPKESEPPKTETKQVTNPTPSKEEIEELLLRDKDFDDEAIAQVKALAKGKGVSLLAAKEDPLYQAWATNRAEEKKKAEAKLGASKGSGRVVKKDFNTPGLSAEEHKEKWREMQGR